jgi:hypothetical protein
MNMELNPHYANRDPELVFLDEAIALLKVINARTTMLIAEYDHVKKAIANEPQPDAGKSE